jgi:hypothetical protein
VEAARCVTSSVNIERKSSQLKLYSSSPRSRRLNRVLSCSYHHQTHVSQRIEQDQYHPVFKNAVQWPRTLRTWCCRAILLLRRNIRYDSIAGHCSSIPDVRAEVTTLKSLRDEVQKQIPEQRCPLIYPSSPILPHGTEPSTYPAIPPTPPSSALCR